MPRTKAQVATELKQTLDDNDVPGFIDAINMAMAIDFDWEYKYGKESGSKTILQLALEEDDGEPYVEELIKAGTSANRYNPQTGSAPIHTAATEALPAIFRLLLVYPANKADVNVVDKDGLSAFHILLGQLIDLASLESAAEAKAAEARAAAGTAAVPAAADASESINSQPTEDDIGTSMSNVADCLIMLAEQKDLKVTNFNQALVTSVERASRVKSRVTLKKLTTMTPLQIICSFQTWNAKPISDGLHSRLELLVSSLLSRTSIDPNATGAASKGALAGAVAGSTPPAMLAATRGYFRVVDVFKKHGGTDFMVENKFGQTILHVVIKAGYYNKIAVHGENSGLGNVRTLQCLFSDGDNSLLFQMMSIVNKTDSFGNTALHYAKPYPSQEVARILLANGGKMEKNPQGVLNLIPRTLEEHLTENCLVAEGEDIDDEEFRIRINYQLFEKMKLSVLAATAADLRNAPSVSAAWSVDMTKKGGNNNAKQVVPPPLLLAGQPTSTGKVDTKRLVYFSSYPSMHYLLKHPVVASFLEMELNSLLLQYYIDFTIYLAFVIVLLFFLTNRYTYSTPFIIYEDTTIDFVVTPDFIILIGILAFLILREIWQLVRYKRRCFFTSENYTEWIVIVLVIICLIPGSFLSDPEAQRHVAALTLLVAFFQLYVLLVRIVPNTPIPVYVNMYTTVLKTYTFILLSYFAYIMSFSYAFYLIFHPDTYTNTTATAAAVEAALVTTVTTNGTNGTMTNGTTTTNATTPITYTVGDPYYANIGISLVRTLVGFIGEIDYTNMIFSHWLAYVILCLFIFLIVIVLMNVLNGLAVSDIRKIMQEIDTYYHVAIVEALSYTSNVTLLAEEVLIYPNIAPEHQKIFGVAIPGTKVYRAKGGRINETEKKKKDFFLREETVKAAKELVFMRQQQNQSIGAVTLESLRDSITEVKREQNNIKLKLTGLEEGIKTIVDIMVSRQPVVHHV